MPATLVGRSAPVFGTASATPGSVASLANDDLAIIYVVVKATSGTALVQLSENQNGWEGGSSSVALVGTGTPALDAGVITIGVFAKRVSGGTLGTLPTIFTTNGSCIGVSMSVYRPAANEKLTWTYTSGTDTTANTAWAPTGMSNPGLISGDVIEILSGVTSDTPMFSLPGLTATGATITTPTEIYDTGTTNGNDEGFALHATSVTAGEATAAPVFTATMSTATAATGGSFLVRIRSIPIFTDDNLCPNPAAGVNTTGFSTSGTLTRVTGLSGAPRTTAAQGTPASGGNLRSARAPVVVGTTYFVSAYYTVGQAVTVNRRINWYTSGGSLISSSTQVAELLNNVGIWRRGWVIAQAPATAATVEFEISPQGTTTNMQMTAVMVSDVVDVRPYGDGSVGGGWTWDGTADNSASRQITTDIALLTDTFDSTIDSKWTTVGSPTVSSGRVNLPCTSGYSSITSNGTGQGAANKLTGSSCKIEVVQAPLAGNNTTQLYFFLASTLSPKNCVQLSTLGSAGTLRINAERVTNGAAPVNIGFVTYNATDHRWWRIRESSGTIYFEAGPDGTNFPTAIANIAVSATGINTDSVLVELGCGYFGAETTPRDGIVDNLNTVPITTHAGAVTLIATPTLALDGTVTTPGGVPGTLTYIEDTNAVSGTTTTTPASFVGTPLDGDFAYIYVVNKPSSFTPATPSGWTQLTSVAVGTGSDGVGTGLVRITVFHQVVSGGAVTMPAIACTGTGACIGAGAVLCRPDAGATADHVTASASDIVDDTTWNLSSGSDLGVVAGDLVMTVSGFSNPISGAASANALTGSGITVGSNTELTDSQISGGNKADVVAALARNITGTSSGPQTINLTLNASMTNRTGGVVFVRMRSVIPAGAAPGSVFDLTNWKLTIPTGSPNADEILQPELDTYQDPLYFALDGSNQMVMTAPVNGVTTSGSSATRSELREMDGASESAWNSNTANRALTVSGYYDPTNITGGSAPKKVMIVGQIHATGGTPPIYITVDYDASPSRLRLFKDGPGVGDLVTNFTPTDRLAYRIETTGGKVNVYGVIGTEADLPTMPQFSFDASSFVEQTGWYHKTGAYNKTDDSTGATGSSIATIVYLDLNQAITPRVYASLSLIASPTLTVSPRLTEIATVSLTATPTLTVNGITTKPASITLTASPTLTISPQLTEASSVSLIASPTLTVAGVTTKPATIALTASPTLTISPQLTEVASVSLITAPTLTISGITTKPASITLTGSPTLSVDAIRTTPATINLTTTPTLVISPQLSEIASVSLIATPTLSINGTVTGPTIIQASVTLTVTPSLSIDGVRITPATVSLTILPSLTITPGLQLFASLSLTMAPNITINGVRVAPASVALIVTPTLVLSAQLTTFASVSLIATPTLSVDATRIVPASISLTATPTLAVNAFQGQFLTTTLTISPTLSISPLVTTQASLSLTITPTGSFLLGGLSAAATLSITPTISISALRTALPTLPLTISPTLSVDGLRIALPTISLTITPTLTITPQITTQASVTLSIIPTASFTMGGLGASIALSISPTLSINAIRVTDAALTLVASPTLSIDAIRTTPSTISLSIIPSLSISIIRAQTLSISLTATPTFAAVFGAAQAALSLTITPTVSITPSYIARPTVALTALPTLIVSGFLKLPATLALTISPTLSVAFFGQTPASLALIISPIISVNVERITPASVSFIISTTLSVNAVRLTLPLVNLLITPTISFALLRVTFASLDLLIIPTISLRGAIEGAGPGWPIVFRLGVVHDGNEAVPSTETQLAPSFALQSVTSEAGGSGQVTKPFITFKE